MKNVQTRIVKVVNTENFKKTGDLKARTKLIYENELEVVNTKRNIGEKILIYVYTKAF